MPSVSSTFKAWLIPALIANDHRRVLERWRWP